jgi:biopolymer transport protein TolR
MRRPRKSINQINVVPYIDVMLVLLVIFMVTAPLITPGEIELPTVGNQLQIPVDPMVISLNANKTLSLQVGSAPAIPMLINDILARVADQQAKNPAQPVVVSAKGSVPYQDVVTILDKLQQSRIRNVGLLARTQTK